MVRTIQTAESMIIPDDLRVCTWEDFVEPNKDKLIIGITFYVHTFHSDELEKHITKKGLDIHSWAPWFCENRVYIKSDKVIASRQSMKLTTDFSSIDDI